MLCVANSTFPKSSGETLDRFSTLWGVAPVRREDKTLQEVCFDRQIIIVHQFQFWSGGYNDKLKY